VQARGARRCGVPGWVADGCAYCYVVDGSEDEDEEDDARERVECKRECM